MKKKPIRVNRMADYKGDLDAVAVAVVKGRENRGISQTALAAAISSHQSVISRLECGRTDPRLTTLIAIARELDLCIRFEPCPGPMKEST